MQLLPYIKGQFFDEDGVPLVGGKIFSYAANTSTPLATYTDQAGGTENENPVILDANGEASIWLSTAAYKFIIKDANDQVLKTIDNVSQLQDGSVTTAKIADGAVTQAKLAAKTVQKSAITIPTTSSTTAVAATGGVSITGTGRPIHVRMIGDVLSGTPGRLKLTASNNVPLIASVEIWRDLVKIESQSFGFQHTAAGAAIHTVSTAGTTTWTPDFTGWVMVKGCAGGGAGGGSYSSSSGGGGGGGGGDYSEEWLYVTSGVTYDIVVGAGGTGVANADGNPGGSTTISTGGETLLKWNGGGGGDDGTDSTGPGGDAGTGSGNGGNGGNGGAGDAGTGIVGTAGNRGTGRHVSARGGTVTASTPSGGNGGGGGGGGGSIGVGGDGPSNTGAGNAAAGIGGGGAGARGVNGANTAGYSGGGGKLEIFDAASMPGASSTVYIPPSAFGVIDREAPAGSNSYSVKVFVSNAGAVLSPEGTISLEAYEL